MKISDSNQAPISNLGNTSPITPGGTAARPGGSSTERKDQVHLSGLTSVLSALNSESTQHAEKLTNLSNDVSAGRYRVDAHVLSGRIIEEHLRAAA